MKKNKIYLFIICFIFMNGACLAQSVCTFTLVNKKTNYNDPIIYRLFASAIDMWPAKPDFFFEGNRVVKGYPADLVKVKDNGMLYFINGNLDQQAPLYCRNDDTVWVDSKSFESDYEFYGKYAYDWNFYKKLRNAGFPIMGSDWDISTNGNYKDNVLKKKEMFDLYIKSNSDSLSSFYAERLKQDGDFVFIKSMLDKYPDYSRSDSTLHKEFLQFAIKYTAHLAEENKPYKSWAYYLAIRSWNAFVSKYKYGSITDADQIQCATRLKSSVGDAISYLILKRSINSTIPLDSPYLSKFITTCKDTMLVNDIKRKSGSDPVKSEEFYNNGSILLSKLIGEQGIAVNWKDYIEEKKGKIIYIDFWASWCGPCKAEMKEMKNKIKSGKYDEKIIFLNLSIDEDDSKWKSTMTEMNLRDKGYENYRIDLQSYFGKELIPDKFIPRYVLIGKDGKVISFNAFRPSSKIFDQWFESISSK